MKISDLLYEAKIESRLRDTGRQVMLSNSWNATWQHEHTKFGDLTPELEQFLLDKCWFDPPASHGKKDFPFSGANVSMLRGYYHAHMHFGKVVIIYQVDAEHVKLYMAGDHKIVEGGGNLATLGRTVRRLQEMPWKTIPAPARHVQSVLDDQIIQATNDWLQLLADGGATLNQLYKFAQNIREFIHIQPYVSWEPKLETLTPKQLQQMVIDFLKKN